MIAECLKLNIPIKDKDFDGIYPASIRAMSGQHFTEIEVAIKAAELLVTKPKQNILDIGCGVGKFCFVAEVLIPKQIIQEWITGNILLTCAKS
jgi:hypothetical protein